MNATRDKFGKFFVQNLCDRMLGRLEELLAGQINAREKLQNRLSSFTDEQKQVVRDLTAELIMTGMHDLLFAIQEDAEAGGSLKILMDGQEVAKLSDGLHGEIFGDDGWVVRFSKYPAPEEIEGSKKAREFIANMLAKRDEPAA